MGTACWVVVLRFFCKRDQHLCRNQFRSFVSSRFRNRIRRFVCVCARARAREAFRIAKEGKKERKQASKKETQGGVAIVARKEGFGSLAGRGGGAGRQHRPRGRRRMPYSLTIKPPERTTKTTVWEGEGSDPTINHAPQRRFSISTPGELKTTRPGSSILVRAASLSDEQELPKLGVSSPSFSSSRVERLVRERQLRRSGSCYAAGDEVGKLSDASSLGHGGLGMESGAGDRRTAPENSGSHQAAGAAAGGGEGVRGGGLENCESNLNEKGQHRAAQRLLVVANRLPVSAIREGDSWDLRLSPGGLVSALLGTKSFFLPQTNKQKKPPHLTRCSVSIEAQLMILLQCHTAIVLVSFRNCSCVKQLRWDPPARSGFGCLSPPSKGLLPITSFLEATSACQLDLGNLPCGFPSSILPSRNG